MQSYSAKLYCDLWAFTGSEYPAIGSEGGRNASEHSCLAPQIRLLSNFSFTLLDMLLHVTEDALRARKEMGTMVGFSASDRSRSDFE